MADFITITNTIYNITFEEEEKTRLLRGSLSDWHVTYKRFSVNELARFSSESDLVVHFYIFCCMLIQCNVTCSRRFFLNGNTIFYSLDDVTFLKLGFSLTGMN